MTEIRVNLHPDSTGFQKFNLVGMASGRIVLPNSVPVGYRFHPTDEEIVSHFLENKMLGNDHLVHPIPEVDVCKYEPWELPKFSMVYSDDPEWFFFTARDFKYCHGHRANRATRGGFWKATGKDRKIKARKTKNLIGTKKTLVFHKGRVPNGVKTNWVMHEYHSVNNDPQRTEYVVCRLKKKDNENVDKLANDKCENDNVDSYLQSRTIERAMPEVWPEENGGLLFTPPLPEANSELLCPSAHLNEIDVDEFMNSLLVDGEEYYGKEYYDEETAYPFDNLFAQSDWTGSTHLEINMLSIDTDLEATGSLFGDLPPNSNIIAQCSSGSVQPQIRMMRHSRGSMFQSKHVRAEEQGNIYRCNEFSGPDISGESTDDLRRINRSFETNAPLKRIVPKKERHINPLSDGRAVSRIRLQRKIGNAAVNSIKAEEASKYTSNDRREENKIRTRPPSEYFANVIVGIILFIVFGREMVLYGKWGI